MRRATGLLLAASVALVVTACAGTAGAPDAPWTPRLPELPQEVHVVGTVLETDGAPVLCVGPIMESYPPQCSGLPLTGWDWNAVDDEETASDVTWGAYAVWGDWDGETVTVTREPVLAALFDPVVDPSAPSPWDETLPTGPLSESESEGIRNELERAVPDVLGSAFVNGRLVLEVRFDDGTLQSSIDEHYGEDAVVVIPSLKRADAG